MTRTTLTLKAAAVVLLGSVALAQPSVAEIARKSENGGTICAPHCTNVEFLCLLGGGVPGPCDPFAWCTPNDGGPPVQGAGSCSNMQ